MTHKILTVPCLTVFLSVAGCNRSSTPQIAPIPSLTVEELLANPQSHSHTLVKVTGCFVTGMETTVLRPCSTKDPADRIWVENAGMFEFEKLRLPEVPAAIPPELRSSALESKRSSKGTDLFQYDAERSARAWQKLESLSGSGPTAPRVVLLGQFETNAPRSPGEMESGFGHLGACAHELILVDVLDSKLRSTQ